MRCVRESNADIAAATAARLTICADVRAACRSDVRSAVYIGARPDACDDTRSASHVADRLAFCGTSRADYRCSYCFDVRLAVYFDLPAVVFVNRADTPILALLIVDRDDNRILAHFSTDCVNTCTSNRRKVAAASKAVRLFAA